MKSLLDALQEGRLVELSPIDKNEVLRNLAHILEAVPGMQAGIDVEQQIQEREAEGNTALGKGIACPHIRVKSEGELLCAVGWSPQGIEYGAPDGKKVYIVIMYCIPDSQRVAYLKELSGLAKAVSKMTGETPFENLGDIQAVRNRLLDWVEMSVSDAVPDATARMIRLEQKQAAAVLARPAVVIPFSCISLESGEIRILSHDQELMERLENNKEIGRIATAADPFETEGYSISVLSSETFASNRVLRQCVAIKSTGA